MSNALQHTPERTPITVRVGTIDDDSVLEVADEGPGMTQGGCAARVRSGSIAPTHHGRARAAGKAWTFDRRLFGLRARGRGGQDRPR